MSDEARALRWAKEVWRQNAPSDAEVWGGADRVARNFTVARRPLHLRKAWQVAGVTAVVLGALAYAGRGVWQPSGAPKRSEAMSNVTPIEVSLPSGQGALPDETRSEAQRPPDDTHLGPAGTGAPTGPSTDVTSKPAGPSAGSDAKRRRVDVAQRATAEPASDQATWVDVSNALAAHDHALAERLLIELSGREQDANTRAKAHLGLAQLDESRGNCERARHHALIAAAIPDVEIKTIRRALELAARCAR